MAVKPLYEKEFYHTQVIKDTDQPLNKQIEEYIRLSKEKNRRLDNIEKHFGRSKLLTENSKAPDVTSFYDKNGNFDKSSFAKEFNATYKFVSHPWTSMKGFRTQLSESIKSLNKLFQYYDKKQGRTVTPRIFTKKNVWNLYDFLDEYYQSHKEQKIPASDEVVDIYVEAVRLNMDLDSLSKNMDYWKTHYEEMKNLKPIESSTPISSNEYEELLHNR